MASSTWWAQGGHADQARQGCHRDELCVQRRRTNPPAPEARRCVHSRITGIHHRKEGTPAKTEVMRFCLFVCFLPARRNRNLAFEIKLLQKMKKVILKPQCMGWDSATCPCTSCVNPGGKSCAHTLGPAFGEIRPSALDPKISSLDHKCLHIVLSFALQ